VFETAAYTVPPPPRRLSDYIGRAICARTNAVRFVMQSDCEMPFVAHVSNLGCPPLDSPPRKRGPTRRRILAGILWLVLVVLVVLWLIGLIANIGGGLIHLLLVVAVLVLLYNLLMSRRTAP
jgi:hypothetical protein